MRRKKNIVNQPAPWRQHVGRRSYGFGVIAEWCALGLLCLKGYRVLGRRVKTPLGEIDLIVQRRKHIVFIEVKGRKTSQEALACVTPHQMARITRAARFWMATVHRESSGKREMCFRCDLIAVSRLGWPVHLENMATIL